MPEKTSQGGNIYLEENVQEHPVHRLQDFLQLPLRLQVPADATLDGSEKSCGSPMAGMAARAGAFKP